MTNLKGQTKRPNKTKNERGITLVALIITIIILIILAAVTINALTHDGLADMAIKGAEDYDKAQKDEMNMLNEIDSMVKETIKNIEDGTTKPKPEEPSNPWGKDDLDEVKVKDENGNDVSIPKPEDSTILNPDATVDQGIVMKDSKDNEWVWVPIDEATYNSMFEESETPIALSGSTGVTTTKYSKSEILSGITRGVPRGNSQCEPDIITNATYGDTANYRELGFDNLNDMAMELVSDYKDMTDSIKKYEGFYIGRYELSKNGVKKNQVPFSNLNWGKAYKECKDLTIDDNKGKVRMIWGCQWDATCLWISSKGDKVNLTDSRSYGNYNTGSKAANTGATAKAVTNNIYDLAGNLSEHTQEAYNEKNRAERGGDFHSGFRRALYSNNTFGKLCDCIWYRSVLGTVLAQLSS